MKKSALLLKVIQNLNRKKAESDRSVSLTNAGFTFLELLVVILMIGVLATIAAPGWLAFSQQRRVTAANESILRALQEAQSQAKKTKRSYSVSFRTDNGVPQIAVYPTKTLDGTDIDVSGEIGWRNLGQDLEIKPKQIMVGTNLDGENEKQAQIDYDLEPTNKITFDYLGALPPTNVSNSSLPLTIVVAAPNTNGQANASTLRCIKVTTLLGTLVTERKGSCLANNLANN